MMKNMSYKNETIAKRYSRALIESAGSDIDVVRNFLNDVDNLYCIGRNGQHRYNNMDHSMITAIKAVDVIVNNKKDKSSIWSVNVDRDYHEKR